MSRSLASYGSILCAPLLLVAVSRAQSTPAVHDVDVCDLLHSPTTYNGQLLRFRGRLNQELEGAEVNDKSCQLPFFHAGIWWEYGGEPVSISAFKADPVRKVTTPIVRDADFSEFEAKTHAHRTKRPDGEICGSYHACALYDVVATFTGKFFAGDLKTAGGGYGHMGCCDLFVIEQIADVEATRTLVPSEETHFTCHNDAWQTQDSRQPAPDVDAYPTRDAKFLAEQMDAHRAMNQTFLAEQMEAHGEQALIEEMRRELSPLADSPDTCTGLRETC